MRDKNWFLLKICAFLFFLILIVREGLHYIPSADLFWQLAAGRYMVFTHHILKQDCFSFTAQGLPWLNHEWLAEIIFFVVFNKGGFVLIHIFKILILLAAFLVLFKVCFIRKISFFSTILSLVLAVLFSMGNLFFDVRPYLFTYILGSLLLLCLYKYKASNKILWLWVLPALMLFWVNLHGGFSLGFLLFLPFLLEEFINSLKNKKSDFIILGIFFILTLFSAFINPWGIKIWEILAVTMGEKTMVANLIEWIPPAIFGIHLPYFIYLCTVNILFLINFEKKLSDVLLLLMLNILFFSAVRHITIFSMFTAPLLAVSIDNLIKKLKYINFNSLKILEKPIAFLGIISILLYSFYSFKGVSLSELSLEWKMFPKEGARFLKANKLPRRIFNPYEWGGYIIFKLYPEYQVFIDGRANTAYPVEVYINALKVMFGTAKSDKILDKYNINLVICNILHIPYGHYIALKLERNDKWKKIYQDNVCVIFLRKSKLKNNFHFTYPDSFYQNFIKGKKAIRMGSLDESEKSLRKALSIYPFDSPTIVDLGYVLSQKNKELEAFKLFKRALSIDPAVKYAHYNLGVYYLKKGKIGKARKEFYKELKVNPDFTPARESLKQTIKIKQI